MIDTGNEAAHPDYVSLGAGNTGRAFDLETNQRIAEFKFIHWQGGPESIRQNSLFKDFHEMAECETPKEKYLCVLGTEHGEKFFNGGRALSSVLKGNVTLRKKFTDKFGIVTALCATIICRGKDSW
jgi:hypothetical protein